MADLPIWSDNERIDSEAILNRVWALVGMPFEWHVRLLHHILLPVGEYSPRDPRAQLRHVEVAQGSAHRDFAGHGFARRLCKVEQLGPQKIDDGMGPFR